MGEGAEEDPRVVRPDCGGGEGLAGRHVDAVVDEVGVGVEEARVVEELLDGGRFGDVVDV